MAARNASGAGFYRVWCWFRIGSGPGLNNHQAADRDVCAIAQDHVSNLGIDMHAVDLPSDQRVLKEAHSLYIGRPLGEEQSFACGAAVMPNVTPKQGWPVL
jgi:hypothetical protein